MKYEFQKQLVTLYALLVAIKIVLVAIGAYAQGRRRDKRKRKKNGTCNH